jgi:hypothetical protein
LIGTTARTGKSKDTTLCDQQLQKARIFAGFFVANTQQNSVIYNKYIKIDDFLLTCKVNLTMLAATKSHG